MTVEVARHPSVLAAAQPDLTRRITSHPIIRFIRSKPLGAFGAAIVLLLVITAIFADFIAPYDPILQDVPYRLRPPDESFWFGTDIYGRDQFSRIVYGARISLYVGMLSVIIGTVFGVLIGVTSGYLGGNVDLAIQRVMDAMM